MEKTIREDIIETTNKLFNYTDAQNWQGLLDEVLAKTVWFDMLSLGAGEPKNMEASAICSAWSEGFIGIDAIHHQAGNYIVTFHENKANVFCYAIALHYKKNAVHGNTREFIGSYYLSLEQKQQGWRISSFRYVVKFVRGNEQLD